MSPSQTDFLRKMDLMNVSSLGVDEAVKDQVNAPGHEALENGLNSATSETVPNSGVGTPFGGYRWKLWHPEQESDELWNDVLTQGELYNFVDAARNPEEEVQYQEPPRDPDETMEKQVSSEAPALRAKRHGISPKKFMDECFDGDDGGASYRKRRRTMGVDETLNCPMCDYRSPREHFGKHLISHYHLHHSKLPRDHPKAQQLVFDHLDDIVKLSPFRCQPCSFYCNWSKYFIAHWERAHSTSSGGRLFWCSFCEFTCVGGHKMLEHLKGDRHGEIVSAIGRVVPIVIRYTELLFAPRFFCWQESALQEYRPQDMPKVRRHLQTERQPQDTLGKGAPEQGEPPRPRKVRVPTLRELHDSLQDSADGPRLFGAPRKEIKVT